MSSTTSTIIIIMRIGPALITPTRVMNMRAASTHVMSMPATSTYATNTLGTSMNVIITIITTITDTAASRAKVRRFGSAPLSAAEG
ncbi:MAG TPA: hypothetical protein VIF13_03115 [Hyphomicrobium sp.]